MRIVVLDGHVLNPGDNPWDDVQALGELIVHERTAADEIIPRAQDADVLLTNKTPLTEKTLKQLPDLQLISVLATGYDVVDVNAAAKLGIPVCNVPGYAADAVPQFVFAMILEANHRILSHSISVRTGEWSASKDWCYWKSPQIELAGQTIGIVGFGTIGQRVAEIAHAFGMQVKVYTPHPKPAPQYQPFSFVSLDELFSTSDVVTLHCPLTEDNARFVDKTLLERMKSDALLVNTARGGLINEADLASHLDEGRIRGAALDVVSTEPITMDNPLLTASHCVFTPHIAWASQAARARVMAGTATNIKAFQDGAPVNVVNAGSR